MAAALEDEPSDRTLREYRARLLHVVKASYGDMYQHFEVRTSSMLPSNITSNVVHCCSTLLPHCCTPHSSLHLMQSNRTARLHRRLRTCCFDITPTPCRLRENLKQISGVSPWPGEYGYNPTLCLSSVFFCPPCSSQPQAYGCCRRPQTRPLMQ